MSKQESFHDLPLTPPTGTKELWRWLRDELRNAILTGRLKRGTRMPSSRGLARQYQCSRGTVVMAFEHLRAEGYIQGRQGTGTFVALALPSLPLHPHPSVGMGSQSREPPMRPAARGPCVAAQEINHRLGRLDETGRQRRVGPADLGPHLVLERLQLVDGGAEVAPFDRMQGGREAGDQWWGTPPTGFHLRD